MTVAAGKLNRRVVLRSPVRTQDAMGQDVLSFVDVATVWATVKQLSGRELFQAAQVASEVTTTIRIRYREAVESDWQAEHGIDSRTDTYDILAVIHDDEGREFTDLLCKRRDAESARA